MINKIIFNPLLVGKLFVLLALLGAAITASAATLSLSPGTNVYNTGATFSARVVVNSGGQSINAAEGTLRFILVSYWW